MSTPDLLAKHAPDSVEALIEAAAMGRLDHVEALLGRGVSVDARGAGGLTALIISAFAGHELVVTRLLEAKANPNECNDDGETALHTSAVSKKADRLVPLLLAAGGAHAMVDRFGRTPLVFHAQLGRLGAVEALLAAGADPLVLDVDAQGALFTAAMHGHAEVVARLLEAKAPVDQRNAQGATPALVAAANGDVEVLELLARHGADLHAMTDDGVGVFGAAAQGNHLEVVVWLAKRLSPNLVSHPLGTPLHVAAHEGHRTLVSVLAAAGADLESQREGLTPLLLAVSQNQFDAASALLEVGADANFAGAHGVPPLSAAAFVGDAKLVDLFLTHGAKLNATNPQAGTALRAAAEAGRCEVVRLLLARGAKFDSPDAFGKRPIDYARDEGHLEIVELLEAAAR